MGLAATLSLLALGVTVGGFCLWYERRPKELGDVRYFPATIVLTLSVVAVLLALAHLVTLLTGVPFEGRRRF